MPVVLAMAHKSNAEKAAQHPPIQPGFGEFSVRSTMHTVTATRITVQEACDAAVLHADVAGWRAQPPVHPGCVQRSFSGCRPALVLDSAA